MKFVKFVIAMLLVFVIATPALAQSPMKWRLTTHLPSGYVPEILIPRLIERIDKASGGRLQIQAFPTGSLVPANEMLNAVGKGVLEIAWSGPTYWRGFIPVADMLWGSPMTLQNDSTQYDYMWWEMGMIDLAREVYGKRNVYYAAPVWGSSYGSAMSKKPIKSLKDLKGLKLRSFGVTSDLWASYGASVVNIPAGEMYTALSMGTIDAAHWSAEHEFASMKMHEAVKNYTHIPVVHQFASEVIVNLDKWKSLSPDLQQIIIQASRTTAADAAALIRALNVRDHEMMKKAGVAFHYFSDKDVADIRKTAMKLFERDSKKDAYCSKGYEITQKAMALYGIK